MAKRGPITVPDFDPEEASRGPAPPATQDVILPCKPVLDAGVEKFTELARLHWPSQDGGFKLTSFDMTNDRMLRITLGLVYQAMRREDDWQRND